MPWKEGRQKVTVLQQGNKTIKEEVERRGEEQWRDEYGEWHLREILSDSSFDEEDGQKDGAIK